MADKIKISKKSLAEFTHNQIVNMATEFVHTSINMKNVKGAVDECLKKHPELMNGEFSGVVVGRILAQSVLYSIFGNTNMILWKDTATRKQKAAMKACASDMFYICREKKV